MNSLNEKGLKRGMENQAGKIVEAPHRRPRCRGGRGHAR